MKTTEMSIADWVLDQVQSEGPRTRRVLERVPEGREDWKPHDRSMPIGRLATLVATMPSWVAMIVNEDELDIAPRDGATPTPRALTTRTELLDAHDKAVAEACAVLQTVTDDHLLKPWRLLVSGNVVSEDPRWVVLRDTLMHQSHHRGQLTVYLRLNEVPVPSVYGPTADDQRFA
jgi:uncharacterized damage-inducible protein DinB